MKRKLIAVLTGLIAASALMMASAGAAPARIPPAEMTNPYPIYPNEDQYPGRCARYHGVKYRLIERKVVRYVDVRLGARDIVLKYYYHRFCGSFARIDNALPGCFAVLYRTTTGLPGHHAVIVEPVEPHLTFAYTMLGNNLGDRYSWAAVECGGRQLAQTPMF